VSVAKRRGSRGPARSVQGSIGPPRAPSSFFSKIVFRIIMGTSKQVWPPLFLSLYAKGGGGVNIFWRNGREDEGWIFTGGGLRLFSTDRWGWGCRPPFIILILMCRGSVHEISLYFKNWLISQFYDNCLVQKIEEAGGGVITWSRNFYLLVSWC